MGELKLKQITAQTFAPEQRMTLFQTYQRIAPVYDLLELPFEWARYRKLRPLLFEGLSGRILDAGVGTGRNMRFYPRETQVVGIDLSPAMLAHAERRRKRARASIELRRMDVTHMEYADQSFDAAVASFLFIVLPDEQQSPALGELHRVVTRGGLIRILEYVRPQRAIRRSVTRAWDPWVSWAFGASLDRQTEAHIRERGLEILDSRFVLADIIKLITIRC